jgi:hypothetical protein
VSQRLLLVHAAATLFLAGVIWFSNWLRTAACTLRAGVVLLMLDRWRG